MSWISREDVIRSFSVRVIEKRLKSLNPRLTKRYRKTHIASKESKNHEYEFKFEVEYRKSRLPITDL